MTTAIARCKDEGEADILAGLGARTFSETFGHLYAQEDLAAFLDNNHSKDLYRRLIADPDHAVWLARNESGEPVGYMAAGPCNLPVEDMPESAGELVRLYLLEDHRGGGLGGQMMSVILDWLEARFEHIYLSVYADNLGAQRLYARYGFEKVCDYFFMVGNHKDPEFIFKRTTNACGAEG